MPQLDANEIIPGLFQGSMLQGAAGPMFSMVVGCAAEIQPKFPEKLWDVRRVLLVPLYDTTFDPKWHPTLKEVGAQIAAEIRRGGRVLVTCHLGINRSALVVGYALAALGYKSIVPLIKSGRPQSLTNWTFLKQLQNLEQGFGCGCVGRR